jgi:hypothetical protein
MAPKEADLVGDYLVEQGWEVDLEVVGGVVDGLAVGRPLGDPDGQGRVHEVLVVADADQQRAADVGACREAS